MSSSDKLQYSFPILPVEELVAFMNDVKGIGLEEKDFKSPTSVRWHHIYCQLVEAIGGFPFESILQQCVYATDDLEYPELHNDSIPNIMLTLTLKRLLTTCGFDDFSLNDIMEPSANRVKKIMCAVVNFVKFKEGRLQVYHEQTEENDRYKDQFEHLLRLNEQYRSRIEALEAEKPKYNPQIQQLQEDIEVNDSKMQELSKRQALVQKSVSEIKSNVAEKIAAKDQVKLSISQAIEEGNKLSQKIVQSPERVKEEQENMKQHLLDLKGNIERKRQSLEAKRQQLEAIEVHTSNIQKALRLLHAVKDEVDNSEKICKEITAMQDKSSDKRNNMRDLQKKIERIDEQITNRQEKLYRLSLQQQNKMKGMTETLNQMQEQKSMLIQETNDKNQGIKEVEEQKQRLISLVKDRQKCYEDRVKSIMKVYSELLENVDAYHTRLGQGWNKIRDVLQED